MCVQKEVMLCRYLLMKVHRNVCFELLLVEYLNRFSCVSYQYFVHTSWFIQCKGLFMKLNCRWLEDSTNMHALNVASRENLLFKRIHSVQRPAYEIRCKWLEDSTNMLALNVDSKKILLQHDARCDEAGPFWVTSRSHYCQLHELEELEIRFSYSKLQRTTRNWSHNLMVANLIP